MIVLRAVPLLRAPVPDRRRFVRVEDGTPALELAVRGWYVRGTDCARRGGVRGTEGGR